MAERGRHGTAPPAWPSRLAAEREGQRRAARPVFTAASADAVVLVTQGGSVAGASRVPPPGNVASVMAPGQDRSLLPTAGVAVTDRGRVLLVRRADDGTWCLPGGRMEFGESVSECARREFVEETGRPVDLTGLLGVYSDPGEQTHRYPDGTVVQFVGVVFTGTAGPPMGPLAGDTVEVDWFSPSELPSNLMACDAPIIRDALAAGLARPVVA